MSFVNFTTLAALRLTSSRRGFQRAGPRPASTLQLWVARVWALNFRTLTLVFLTLRESSFILIKLSVFPITIFKTSPIGTML